MFKDEINKLLTAKVIWESQSSWSAPIIVVPKGDGGKHLVINYHALNKNTWKFIWPMPKVEDIFHSWMAWNTSQPWLFRQDITTFHWMNIQYLKQPSLHHLENMNTSKYPLDSHKHLPISGTHDMCLKGFSFCYCLLVWYNHLQHDCRGTLRQSYQTSFWKITECSFIHETQRMPLLYQRYSVPWTHPQHHRHHITTIEDSSYQ